MGVLTKGRHKLTVGDRLFLWWVGDDPDGANQLLHVFSEDKRFLVQYELGQRGVREPFLIVLGREFPGVPDAGGVWVRVRTPDLGGDRTITPRFVRRLIDWCMDPAKDVCRVDWHGMPV